MNTYPIIKIKWVNQWSLRFIEQKTKTSMHAALDSITFGGPPWVEYLFFILISLTNVFLQNLKNIFLIKSTRLKAALIGMITSIFYATVVVMIAKHGWISVLIVAVTHFLGIFLARTVSDNLEKKGLLKQK